MITAFIALTFLAAGVAIGARYKEASHGIDRLVEAHERDVDVLDAADMAQDGAL